MHLIEDEGLIENAYTHSMNVSKENDNASDSDAKRGKKMKLRK